MTDFTVLIADDEMPARFGMRRALDKEPGISLVEAASGHEALAKIEAHAVDLVLLDINLPDLDGMAVLERLAGKPDAPLVVMVTAYNATSTVVEAIKRGAHDYLTKPYEVDELRHAVRRSLEHRRLARENQRLARQLERLTSKGDLLGGSDAMRLVFGQLEKVQDVNVNVLITGESGTGKELVAREIHARGHRQAGPFVSMNCAALPENLIESELFGHEKGAFTGASMSRAGKFELADGGTLFLDEVGDMSLGTQAKMLRAIEEREFRRLGGSETHKVDVQLVSATHKDLAGAIEDGSFRRDLLYRIKVVEIRLPALRERPTDIPLLVDHFVAQLALRHRRKVKGVSPDALKLLVAHPWPGNVRQLRNCLEQAIVLADSDVIAVGDLPQEFHDAGPLALDGFNAIDFELPFKQAKKRFVQAFERAYLEHRLKVHAGNVTRTAESLDMHRQSLQQKLRELDIKPRDVGAP